MTKPRFGTLQGSAISDAARILGGTIGVAVIGSVYASLYATRLVTALPTDLPGSIVTGARSSVGTALDTAARLHSTGQAGMGRSVASAASEAFFHGSQVAVLLAAAVAIAGSVVALALIPAQPPLASEAGYVDDDATSEAVSGR